LPEVHYRAGDPVRRRKRFAETLSGMRVNDLITTIC
jgi:hypothetical protein